MWVFKEEHRDQRGRPPGSRRGQGASEGLSSARRTLARAFKPNITCDRY